MHAELILNIAANCKKHCSIYMYMFSCFRRETKRGYKFFYSEDFIQSDLFYTWLGHFFDHLGDACRIHFPVEMKSAIRWSKKLINREEDGTLKLIL